MTTSTIVKITLEQKPGIPECRKYTLNVPDASKQQEILSYVASSYEDHEAQIQQIISDGFATVITIEDLPVL